MGFDFVSSTRGRRLLLRAGYKYNPMRKNKDGSIVWRCAKRDICKAVLIITSLNLVSRDDAHFCQRDTIANEILKEMENCQKRVAHELSTPVASIFQESVSKLQESGLDLNDALPEFNNIKNKLYRIRNKYLSKTSYDYKNI